MRDIGNLYMELGSLSVLAIYVFHIIAAQLCIAEHDITIFERLLHAM